MFLVGSPAQIHPKKEAVKVTKPRPKKSQISTTHNRRWFEVFGCPQPGCMGLRKLKGRASVAFAQDGRTLTLTWLWCLLMVMVMMTMMFSFFCDSSLVIIHYCYHDTVDEENPAPLSKACTWNLALLIEYYLKTQWSKWIRASDGNLAPPVNMSFNIELGSSGGTSYALANVRLE